MKFHCGLMLLLSCLILTINAQEKANVRQIEISKKYLNLPVNDEEPGVRMVILADGKPYREFDIHLAQGEPKYWVFAEVDPIAGKTATIALKDHAEMHPGLNKIFQDDKFVGEDSLYREKYRPQFHFSSRRGWNNDPNGLVYYDGEYHLFYQHNPYSINWGNMHWGHAVSSDLVHWKEIEKALFPDELGTMFSGSAVVDHNNTSGFQTGKEKVLVAAYTADRWLGDDMGGLEVQCIAYSNDRGRTWTKYANNPVIGDLREKWGSFHIRDPKVFWYKPGGHWVMVLFEQLGHSIYTSDNLKEWTYQSHVNGFWECPELFELPVDGDPNNKKWVMYGASGSYLIGLFDGKKFTWESGKHWYKDGPLYAAQTYNNIPESDGRRIQIAWGQIKAPGMPFNQMMLFPTELTLRTTPNGVRLFCEPIREIAKLHQKSYRWENLDREAANEALEAVTGELLHIKCDIETMNAPHFGMKIGGNGLEYDYNHNEFNDFPYTILPGSKSLHLEILVDRTSIEVFLDHGALCSVIAKDLSSAEKGIKFWSEGKFGKITVKNLEVHELKSIWE